MVNIENSSDANLLQPALSRQAERIQELRRLRTTVTPKQSGRPLLDSPILSSYELSRVSATFSYLRFFAEIADAEVGKLPVIGELVDDWAVTGKLRSEGQVVVVPSTGTILFCNDQPSQGRLDVIASSATSFRSVFDVFAEYRNSASKLNFDEYASKHLSNEEEELHLELIRKFWTFVAQTDPEILDSGSQFWSNITATAFSWAA